jgi:(p)ppGpp synthase/HD superfamily hydrolase
MLADRRTGAGPLAGIHTALGASRAPWNLIVACDMPGISAPFLQSLLAAARSGQARTHLKAAIARREAEDAAARGRVRVACAVAAENASLRDLEDDGTAFSAARRLGHPDLDALYEAVGRGDLTPDEFVAALALEPAEATGPPVVLQ